MAGVSVGHTTLNQGDNVRTGVTVVVPHQGNVFQDKVPGAVFVGIDTLNIDDTADLRRPVHTALLGRDIPVVEHMTNLGALPSSGFRFFAVPVKVRAFGTFPVRAFAIT